MADPLMQFLLGLVSDLARGNVVEPTLHQQMLGRPSQVVHGWITLPVIPWEPSWAYKQSSNIYIYTMMSDGLSGSGSRRGNCCLTRLVMVLQAVEANGRHLFD